jgi:probable rRNA maturation factor
MSSPEGSNVRFTRVPGYLRPPAIRRFARTLEAEVTKGKRFDCLITGNHELRRLNRAWRGIDKATDVLAFPVCGEIPGQRDFLGDIAISGARANAQAREFGHSPQTEICVLMLHGVLHLLGMDHETDNGRMRRVENRLRKRLGLPAGLIGRETPEPE